MKIKQFEIEFSKDERDEDEAAKDALDGFLLDPGELTLVDIEPMEKNDENKTV